MTFSISNQQGVYTINTGDNSDIVKVRKTGTDKNQFAITVNNETQILDAKDIKELRIDTGKGDDLIDIDLDTVEGNATPIFLFAGEGEDNVIIGSVDNVEIDTGSGRDGIYAQGEDGSNFSPVGNTDGDSLYDDGKRVYYTVQSGDTLTDIAKVNMGDTATHQEIQSYIQDLLQKNPDITHPDKIFPGQFLDLPPGKMIFVLPQVLADVN